MRFSLGFISSLLVSTSVVTAAPLAVRQTGKGTPSPNDILVLTFAGVLERLETEFYKQALAKFGDADFTAAGFADVNIPKTLFSVILGDEEAHTTALDGALKALGGTPVDSCQFDFSTVLTDVKTMAAVARVVEDVGVAAYMGAAPLMDDKELLTAAASILTIEARHQTALNLVNGATPIPQAFDMSLSPSQVLALAAPFISGCDLGIPANAPLKLSNTGSVGVGSKLELESTGISSTLDRSTATCQMLVGGATSAIALPLDNCVVPPGIEGPVFLFVTNSTVPLLNSRVNQLESSVQAGPMLLFLDNFSDPMAAAVVGGSSGSGGNEGDVSEGFTSTFATSTTITPAEATQAAQIGGGNDSLETNPNPATPPPTTSSGPEVVGWSGTSAPLEP